LGTDGQTEHFIYPKEVFPPTDFHSATLVDDQIWLIGCLGYPEQRNDKQTQVLRLSTLDFSITPVETCGVPPGWIHRHRSVLTKVGIFVTGGKIEPGYRDNNSTFLLNLETLVWQEFSDSDR
ncbi:MAG: ankyrin repeat domain-containing protein, partial [Pseudomonadota bacterium]